MQKSGNYRIWAILFITMIFLAMPLGSSSAEDFNTSRDSGLTVKLVYFFENGCASCDDEADFRRLLSELAGDEAEGVTADIESYNTFQPSGMQKIKEYYLAYNVPDDKKMKPVLFINDTFLAGDNEIRKRLKEEFTGAKRKLTQSRIIYFYVSPCDDCSEVKKYFGALDESYPVDFNGETVDSGVAIVMYNIGKFDNLGLLHRYFEKYGVPEDKQEVPVIFMKDGFLAGAESIERDLVNEIKAGSFLGMAGVEMENTGPDSEASGISGLSGYKLAGVFLTGLVNSLNPCSISLLLFFISMVIMKSVSILKLGMSFIAGKFIAYFLFGTLLYNLLSTIEMSWFASFQSVIKIIMIVILIILALMNVFDYFAAKNEKYDKIRMQLPEGLRRWNHRWIEKLTSVKNQRLLILISFLLGMLISAGEMLCTGQIYLVTIIYVLQTSPVFDLFALACFVLYGLAIVIPLVALLIVIHRGREVFLVSELIRSKMPLIKLMTAFIFVAFAVLLMIL